MKTPMPDRPSSRALRFGDFELDVPAYELRKRGRAVKLEPGSRWTC